MTFFDYLVKVRLPDLRCRPGFPCAKAEEISSNKETRGVVFLFEKFLKGKIIHEIIVPDCPEHPHSDAEIKLVLQGTRVKILDWRKKDISITMLQNVAPELEILNLYSSGNQDILEYWTSYFGLYRHKKVGLITILSQAFVEIFC